MSLKTALKAVWWEAAQERLRASVGLEGHVAASWVHSLWGQIYRRALQAGYTV